MSIRRINWTGIAAAALLLAGCISTPPPAPGPDLAITWVTKTAEYRAVAWQTYQTALRVLPTALADKSWSALPGQSDAATLQPAIILDVDETVLDNSPFQARGPYDPVAWDGWIGEGTADPVPGVVDFLSAARESGIDLYYVTNRNCRPRRGDSTPCPQEQETIENLRRIGVPTDAEHMMLRNEIPEWTREKPVRWHHVAKNHRILMLIGDDLGDFVPCVHARVEAPCTNPGTPEKRLRAFDQHRDYWGLKWHALPNPMYGSWDNFL